MNPEPQNSSLKASWLSEEEKSSKYSIYNIDEGQIIKGRKGSGESSSSINTSEDSSYGGVYEGHQPIIGYVKSS